MRPGEVLLAWTDDVNDPNFERCQQALRCLDQARDARGRALKVHKMPIPGPLYATEEECAGVQPAEAANACSNDPSGRQLRELPHRQRRHRRRPSFDDPHDSEAEAILRRLFPEREVVMVPGREILLGGGNIHCITQQQPQP
ncbi:Agmatine deiminase OS=Stutzerimonas stutzeri OX=316 GN=aguA PE=3 SV=1 [Stutzerimonas stutzeri]